MGSWEDDHGGEDDHGEEGDEAREVLSKYQSSKGEGQVSPLHAAIWLHQRLQVIEGLETVLRAIAP